MMDLEEALKWADDYPDNVTIPLAAEIRRLRAELETERMRLVACSVIALANTPESAASARDMHPDYQSPYCDDVARAVDREIALRAELAEYKRDAERYRLLRKQHWNTSKFAVVCDPKNSIKLGYDSPSLERLDDLIDSELLQAQT